MVYIKYLYLFTGNAENVSSNIRGVILVKSTHMTHFYKLSKFLCNTREQDFKCINIILYAAFINYVAIHFSLINAIFINVSMTAWFLPHQSYLMQLFSFINMNHISALQGHSQVYNIAKCMSD
jgi:hypothetical protein